MTKIYVVTTGDYSDYSICGVYDTIEKAEVAQKLFAADNIETYELNAISKRQKGLFYYEVVMDNNGNLRGDSCGGGVKLVDASYLRNSPQGYGDKKHAVFYVWAKNETHAVKIVNEKRGMLIASGEWDMVVK